MATVVFPIQNVQVVTSKFGSRLCEKEYQVSLEAIMSCTSRVGIKYRVDIRACHPSPPMSVLMMSWKDGSSLSFHMILVWSLVFPKMVRWIGSFLRTSTRFIRFVLLIMILFGLGTPIYNVTGKMHVKDWHAVIYFSFIWCIQKCRLYQINQIGMGTFRMDWGSEWPGSTIDHGWWYSSSRLV